MVSRSDSSSSSCSTPPLPGKLIKVAVIGSGLAGLTAAHLLQSAEKNDRQVEVHIFEKANSIGMDSASIDVVGRDGKLHRVDSPMRAVQGGYYEHLLKLYKKIGVQLDKSNFTYSFMHLTPAQSSRSDHATFFEEEDVKKDRRWQQQQQGGKHDRTPAGLESQSQTHEKAQPCARLPSKKTSFIYNGGNGLSLRPFSFPRNGAARRHSIYASNPISNSKSFDFDTLFGLVSLNNLFVLICMALDILRTSTKIALFAISYIYLSLLSFYHVYFTSHTSLHSTHWVSKSTFGSFLQRTYFPRSFIDEILVPLFACVATCSPNEILEYPAAEFLEYIARTFGADHFVVRGGVRTVIQALLRGVPEQNIHLGCQLVSLRSVEDDVDDNDTATASASFVKEKGQKLELRDAVGHSWIFEEVIFATQANQASFLLSDYYEALSKSQNRSSSSPSKSASMAILEREKERLDALSRFQYTQSIVVNHYDAQTTLVDDARDKRILNIASWSSPNSLSHAGYSSHHESLEEEEEAELETKLSGGQRLGREYIMATHDLSILQPELVSPSSGAALLQTTNPTVAIAQESIVSSQVFERAKVTLESREALKLFVRYPGTDEVEVDGSCFQGLGGVWFVGSWAAEGIPLLEGCVLSAERAVKAIMQKGRGVL